MAGRIANVLYYGFNGAGTMFIYFDQVVSGPTCASQVVRVAPTHPQFKSILALAAAAAASGAIVTVATDMCTGNGKPQISETTASTIVVNAT